MSDDVDVALPVDPNLIPATPRFAGSAIHRMTAKNQVSIPVDIRALCRPEVLAAGFMVQVDGLEGDHLNLFPLSEFDAASERLQRKLEDEKIDPVRARGIFRAWSESVSHVRPDAQGRITLPKDKLAAVGIEGPFVKLSGVGRRIEIRPAAPESAPPSPEAVRARDDALEFLKHNVADYLGRP